MSTPSFPEGFPPPAPLPPTVSGARKGIQIKIDPLKSKLNAIQKRVLEETAYDLTKDRELRSRVPVEFKDILPLDEYINVWALGNIRTSLTDRELKDIKNVAQNLKNHKMKFDEDCREAAKMIKEINKDLPATRTAAEHIINQIEGQSNQISQDVADVKERIEFIRQKPVQKIVQDKSEGTSSAGAYWFRDAEDLFKTELPDLRSEVLNYQKELANAKVRGKEPSKKQLASDEKLKDRATFEGWLKYEFEHLNENDSTHRANVIREAVINLGGTQFLKENVADFRKRIS